MVMVLPSLVLLIDAFDVISVMYLSMETRRPRPDTMIKRRQSLICFGAPKTRSSCVVVACSPISSTNGTLFGEMLQYQSDRLLLGLVAQVKPDKGSVRLRFFPNEQPQTASLAH